ncbi:MAG: serine hydrolase [Phycisphaerae bacterium]
MALHVARFVILMAAVALAAASARGAPAEGDAPGNVKDLEYERRRNIEPAMEEIRAKRGVPALAAAVIRDGRLVATAAVGVRKKGADGAVTARDRFHIGSCTKAMTATLVQVLVEQKKLRWEMTLAEAFPDLAPRMHEAYRAVTLLQCAAHRSGMPGADRTWPEGMDFLGVHRLPGPPRAQRRAYVAKILAEEPAAPPGSTFLYSNAGYAVLGAACERAADAPWEDLMRRHLFEPLGMAKAGFGAMGSPGTIEEPWQHKVFDGKETPLEPGPLIDNPPAIGPAGTVHCTIREWAAFVEAHLDGARGRPTPLAVTDWQRLHTPPFGDGFALGWATAERGWAGGTALTHAGSNGMNYAVAWLAPKADFAVVAATNTGADAAPKACDDVAGTMVRRFVKEKAPANAAAAGASSAPESAKQTGKPELLGVRKIWDRAPHNAFTDLVRHEGEWLCVFREGKGHVSHDGKVRVIASKDGKAWTSAALIETPEPSLPDLRDPKISRTPDGRLQLIAGAANRRKGETGHRTFVWFSADGRAWGDATPVADENVWLWRVTWHEGKAYGVGYGREGAERVARLYRSGDGRRFETLVPRLFAKGYPNEATLRFLPDGRGLCLLRRDGSPNTARLGTAPPPYTEWTWQDLGVRVGGPNFIRLPDGRFLAATRRYDGGVRTSLQWLDAQNGTLSEYLRLPSGGDTSYAGLVWHEGVAWVSYYSSHEGKTSIYLARVRVPGAAAGAARLPRGGAPDPSHLRRDVPRPVLPGRAPTGASARRDKARRGTAATTFRRAAGRASPRRSRALPRRSRETRRAGNVVLAAAPALAAGEAGEEKPKEPPPLTLDYKNGILTVRGDAIPGGQVDILYLEAYCRADSHATDWVEHTVIPHRTEGVTLSDDGTRLALRDTLADGVVVDHLIRAGKDEVDFRVAAANPTDKPSEVHWAQPCIRVGAFTGCGRDETDDKYAYLRRSFVFQQGRLQRMPTDGWATEARYRPGQVWAAPGVEAADVNPRPLNPHRPSNGLIGCFSRDEKRLLATAWHPYQELFQGVIRCLHSDFRIGGLKPGEVKRIRGKLYLVPNDIDALLARYWKDFPEHKALHGKKD